MENQSKSSGLNSSEWKQNTNTKESGIKTPVTVGDENHNSYDNNRIFWKRSVKSWEDVTVFKQP